MYELPTSTQTPTSQDPNDPLQAQIDSSARHRVMQALMMQRGMAPQGTGALAGLNQALQTGLQMYGARQARPGTYAPKLPKRDPVMGTGYATQTDPLWSAVDFSGTP